MNHSRQDCFPVSGSQGGRCVGNPASTPVNGHNRPGFPICHIHSRRSLGALPKPGRYRGLTTIDLETFTTGKEPIRTLSRHRKWHGKVFFGIRLIPEAPGEIHVGDAVTPLGG